MKHGFIFVAAAITAGSAFAQSGADVVNAKGCLNCHGKVAPSFKEVARKTKSDAGALMAKLKEGKGHAKVPASDAELKAAVEYVLSQK